MTAQTLPASFRDPSGFLFRGDDGELYRQVNRRYQSDFEFLEGSGLYSALCKRGLLVEHETCPDFAPLTDDGFCVIRPRRLKFISYPYEWAFSALKDAALLTLDIQLSALNHDMQLKDASAYNVQFDGCQPLLIDTLSFERYKTDRPWEAYGQFCRHFLAPLTLMAKTHLDAGYLLRDSIDGIPLDVASAMLPLRTRWSLGMQVHLHLHARMIARHRGTQLEGKRPQTAISTTSRRLYMPKTRLQAYLTNLRGVVESLRPKNTRTQWSDYYENNSYKNDALSQKRRLVSQYIRECSPKLVWDLGANTGIFSQLACAAGSYTCAFDIDPNCIERAYLDGRKAIQRNLLPLRMDLTNPSPALGWAHEERDSLADRGPADLILALALVHHLAIANNVPLPLIARFFQRLGKAIVIEFVPKADPQVQRLLQNREDIFERYDVANFEAAFQECFEIKAVDPVGADGRIMYFMQRR